MISFNLDRTIGVLTVRPEGKLEAYDFQRLSQTVDPFIEEKGKLTGLIIVTEKFPGWKDFSGMLEHIKFVRNHHTEIVKIALVTDTKIADAAELLGKHFIKASVKHFSSTEFELAKNWVTQG
jgi:hypothetical protein